LMAGYLLSSQGDRMLMAHGIEGRYPFLDRDVCAFAATLPDRYKIFGLKEKFLLKQLAANKVPASIVHRVKQPYRAPDRDVLRQAAWLGDMTSAAMCKKHGVFSPQATEMLARKVLQNNHVGNTDISSLVLVTTSHWLAERFALR